MRPEISNETVLQIDCNNPNVDSSVATRFRSNTADLSVTEAGKFTYVNYVDKVPFACPLTQDPGQSERTPENFVTVCRDCPYAFISLLPSIVETEILS